MFDSDHVGACGKVHNCTSSIGLEDLMRLGVRITARLYEFILLEVEQRDTSCSRSIMFGYTAYQYSNLGRPRERREGRT